METAILSVDNMPVRENISNKKRAKAEPIVEAFAAAYYPLDPVQSTISNDGFFVVVILFLKGLKLSRHS